MAKTFFKFGRITPTIILMRSLANTAFAEPRIQHRCCSTVRRDHPASEAGGSLDDRVEVQGLFDIVIGRLPLMRAHTPITNSK